MSRPVRDLTNEDLGDLKAVSSFTNQGKVYWNVTCSYGSDHVFSADELTRKRYPKRSCGVCGNQGYIEQAVYMGVVSHTYGWLRPWGRERLGDIREFKDKLRALGLPKPNLPSTPYWGCTCSGRSCGHEECTIWVNRTTRELKNKTTGSCTMCRPHFLVWRAEEFRRNIQREEQRMGMEKSLSEADIKARTRWTKESLTCARDRVERDLKYRKLGMFEEWKSADKAAALTSLIAHIGLCPCEGMTLERINNKLGYFPGNIRWATKRDQALNRSSARILEVDGQTRNLIEVAVGLGLKPSALSARLERAHNGGIPESVALEQIMAECFSRIASS